MKKRLLQIGGALLILGLILPYSAAAQEFKIPDQARQMVSESDMVEMIGHMTRWKSADLYAHLEAADEILTPLFNDIKDFLGSWVSLEDITAIRMEYEAKIEAVYQSTTVTEAENRVKELMQSRDSLRNRFQDIAGQMTPIAAQMEKQGEALRQELMSKLDAWAQAQEGIIKQQIDTENTQETAALQARMEQKAAEITGPLVAAAGEKPDPAAIKSQVDAIMAPIIAAEGKALQEKMAQRGQELAQAMSLEAEKKADEFSGGQYSKLARIRDSCQNVSQRIEELAQKKMPSYDVYYQKFLEKKGEIIMKAIDAQLAPAEATIRSFASELEMGRKEGRDLPSADELLSRLNEDKQTLAAVIMQAEHDEEIDEAVNQFKANWENIRQSLESAKVQGAQEIIDTTRDNLRDEDVENKLRKAYKDITEGIDDIEKAKAKGKITPKAEETLEKLRQLSPQIQEGLAIIEEFNKAQPADGIEALLERKNRLQEKLESIRRCCEESSLIPGHGIFIEAENESSTRLLNPDVYWHSNKEVNATWRPGSSGNADWYLSRGGEVLIYNFTAPEAGEYILWIRDLATDNDRKGKRRVTVTVDGVNYGAFAEHPNGGPDPPGVFGWHRTATVTLEEGEHVLEIAKEATTVGAAVIDCFYFTGDPDEIPE